MREMKDSRQFPLAMTVATIIMMLVYISIVTLAYLAKGDSLPSFAPDAVTNPHFRQIVGALVAFNVFTSYLLTNVPLAMALHERIAPETSRDFTSMRARVHWLLLTSALLAFSFVVANAIPFFGAFQGMIGSALGAPIVFGWPPLFFLMACKK
jgi:amino acid permease